MTTKKNDAKKAVTKKAVKKSISKKSPKKRTPSPKLKEPRRKPLPGGDDKRLRNQFWLLRSKHGRDKLFGTPELLWSAACEYFQWCEDNPFIEEDFVSGGPMAGTKVYLSKMRPFTIQGLCSYLNCNSMYFTHFENSLKEKTDQMSKDFYMIVTRIREVIYNQKFSGAASGFFNSNIIARDLGLTDKKDLTTDGEKLPGTVIKWGDKEIKV